MPDGHVNVRYMVHFYTTHLGFALLSSVSPAFADVTRGTLRLLPSGPTSSAGRTMPDGREPWPGGWNGIQLVVDDLRGEANRLKVTGSREP